METCLERLCKTLDELEAAELRRFRMYLSDKILEEFEPIPKGQLEDKDATDVAAKMQQAYEDEGSVKITLIILRKMNHNKLANKLERTGQSADIRPGEQKLSLCKITSDPPVRDVCKLTLDPNTLCRELALSEENRKVTHVRGGPSFPDHPERFDGWLQVLCREGLSGQCYWEAEWSGHRWGSIAMVYNSMRRKGKNDLSQLGQNDVSWCLVCSPGSYSAKHNHEDTAIPALSSGSRRVGVYLNWPAGTLSFYSVSSDTLTHLHTFHSTFTEPLYPGFGLHPDSSVSLCQTTSAPPLRDAYKLTLDPDTANRNLSLSEGNKKVTYVSKKQPYPFHPERFDGWIQLLCREGLSECCSWEAEWNGEQGASIAVAYKSMKRKGDDKHSQLGQNEKSWCLVCSPDVYSAKHNNEDTEIPAPTFDSRRVRVYLDWPAGTLSFYSVSSDTLTHLLTFHSTFTDPLYPGFGLHPNSSVSLCQITSAPPPTGTFVCVRL